MFQKALELAPVNFVLVFNKAAAYLDEGVADEARDLFTLVVKKDGKNLEARVGLGIALIKLKEPG